MSHTSFLLKPFLSRKCAGGRWWQTYFSHTRASRMVSSHGRSVEMRCSVLKCSAVRCRAVQCVAVCCSVVDVFIAWQVSLSLIQSYIPAIWLHLQHAATHCTCCNKLQHTTTHHKMLQQTATCCNTLNMLQHTATHCNTPQNAATHSATWLDI